MLGWFWNRIESLAARRATIWPSQHSIHGELLDEIRELYVAIGRARVIMQNVDSRTMRQANPCPSRDEWDTMLEILDEVYP